MSNTLSSYRPHDPGHDYYAPGIYLITLVVRDRAKQPQIFGKLNDKMEEPAVLLNPIGKAVIEEWNKIPAHEAQKGRHIQTHAAICMPDHWHGVLEVLEPMDCSVGQVIWGFKVACTKRWRELTAAKAEGTQPKTVESQATQPSLVADKPSQHELHNLSKKQREEYYRLHPDALLPLWDANYDDTICFKHDDRHFNAMLRYVADNPRRAVIRRLRPNFMERRQHIWIEGIDEEGNQTLREYAAFGNLFLLRWPNKVQVFCHRKSADHQTPYETTTEYRNQCIEWKRQLMQGATVLVTPGISKGEQIIKERCLESGYPLIHLQKEPIGPYWKPEQRRFEACSRGTLLILSPWNAGQLGDYKGIPSQSEYATFHNLNRLVEEICR